MSSVPKQRRKILVKGVVQGVGFRPFVYAQAVRRGLGGYVRNTTTGVLIEVEGCAKDVEEFTGALHEDAPPLAQIRQVSSEVLPAQKRSPSSSRKARQARSAIR